ncbi:unnamed protein product [Colias eurytheme]|nr:unnamed protein product [Colias eurytheme]
MDLKIFSLFLLIFVQTSFGKYEQYEGYTVYGVVIRNQDDINLIQRLQNELDLDIWRAGMPGARHADIMVGPKQRETFVKHLHAQGMEYYIREGNVASKIKNFDEDLIKWTRSRQNVEVYNKYARVAEIDAYMERLAREYPNIAKVVTAGLSFEGRPVKYLKISTTNFEDPSKPIYFMDAAMHAREWVTTPVALYTMHRLVESLRDEDRDLRDNVDWIILPVYNPDGYEYSHTDERMWRASRSFNPEIHEECRGVDLNRNFDIFFMEINASNNPCSSLYAGPYPFSEIENRHVRDILHSHLDRIQIYLNIHSYGSFILYGFDNATLPANVAQIHTVGAAMGAHIDGNKLPNMYDYLVGNSRFVLYPASGTSQDYAQDIGVPFSFTLELPDMNEYGFLVPPQYIPQINSETWAGIAESARLASIFYRARR